MESAMLQKSYSFVALTRSFFVGVSQPVNKNRSYALSME